MKEINVRDIENTGNCYFHFAPREAFSSIEQSGLVAGIGGASKVVDEQERRVYISKGIQGALAIKNSFIYKFLNLSIREIPEDYRPYFGYESYESDERIPREDVFRAYAERMKDEVYFLVDAQEGVDFYKEDIKTNLYGVGHDVNCAPNHDIDVQKLSLLYTPEGKTAYDVVKYMYQILLEHYKDNPDIVHDANSTLHEMFEYIEHGILQEQSTTDIGKQVTERYKEPETIKIEAYDEAVYESMKEMFGLEMAEEYKSSFQDNSQNER